MKVGLVVLAIVLLAGGFAIGRVTAESTTTVIVDGSDEKPPKPPPIDWECLVPPTRKC